MNTNFKNIFIYTRVSTYKQSNNSISLAHQYDVCKKYITSNYINQNILHYQDIASSYKNKNALCRQKAMMRNISQNDLIIIYEISRLGRNIYQVIDFLEKIRNKGAIIYSVEDNLFYGKDKLIDNLFLYKVIKSKEYSDCLSNKTKTTQTFIKENGGHVGKVPYGYKLSHTDGIPKLIMENDEQNIIKLIINKHDKELLSFNDITKYLNNNLIQKRNCNWTFTNVRYIYCRNKNLMCKDINMEIDDSIGTKRSFNSNNTKYISKRMLNFRSLIIN
jgi:DNA invertase Pin-like site-specific DNA recombinase